MFQVCNDCSSKTGFTGCNALKCLLASLASLASQLGVEAREMMNLDRLVAINRALVFLFSISVFRAGEFLHPASLLLAAR